MRGWKELTAEEFYDLRDERTRTLNTGAGAALQKAKLALSIDEREAETLAGQLAFLLLVNLNARWCRDLRLRVPDIALHPELHGLGDGNLPALALRIARGADPFGIFTVETDTDCPTMEASVAVHVGGHGPNTSYPVVGRGWIAAAGQCVPTLSNHGERENPLGAVLAACIGTCYAMRRSLNLTPLFSDVKLSLWNMAADDEILDGPLLRSMSLGRVLIVGAGAIGSGIAYLLPLIRPRIECVMVVDGDIVDYPNLNRVPLFYADAVGSKKVDIVRSYLEGWGVRTDSISSWFEDAGLSLGKYDLLIPAANERGAREGIMDNNPPIMISGSTGSQWDAYQQRHIPLVDDCLLCRFPPRKQIAQLTCSTGEISQPESGAPKETGALPFLSLAGAVMAVTEIAKLAYEQHPAHGNYSTLWFSGEVLDFVNATKAKRSKCSYCINSEIFEVLGKHGLFAHFSAG